MFGATARRPERSLGLSGALALEPDRRLIQLERLSLDARGVTWQLAPNAAATIAFGGDAVVIADLRLVSADQRIDVTGAVGGEGDALDVILTNVDLANVDRLLLRPPQFTGRVNATESVMSSLTAPDVDATFQVTQGGFRQFKYETLEAR